MFVKICTTVASTTVASYIFSAHKKQTNSMKILLHFQHTKETISTNLSNQDASKFYNFSEHADSAN